MLFEEAVFFLGEPQRPWGRLVGIDIFPVDNTLVKADRIRPISSYVATHFWCIRRKEEVNKIEEEIERATEGPSSSEKERLTANYLGLDQNIYDIQKKWGALGNSIPREIPRVRKRVSEYNFRHESTEYKYTKVDERGEKPELLEAHLDTLNSNVDTIESDHDRVDSTISSVTVYFDNQVSALISEENIRLQKGVKRLTDWLIILTSLLVVESVS